MRTLVYGLGESGVAATRALAERGEKVVVADDSHHRIGADRRIGRFVGNSDQGICG